MAILSGDMRGARDRSRARPVGDEARRSVGNRKECRLRHDYASFPEERKPLPLSFGVCPKGAQVRRVQLPRGTWRAWNGEVLEGGAAVELPVTIRDVPTFERC